MRSSAMSEADEGAVAMRAVTNGNGGTATAAAAPGKAGDAVNALGHLQSQIAELNRKHEAVLSNIALTRSVVYIPREKQIVPFSGEVSKDVHTVDKFIEEVERGMRARVLHEEDQVDFILLKGSALEEIKLRMHMGHMVKQCTTLPMTGLCLCKLVAYASRWLREMTRITVA